MWRSLPRQRARQGLNGGRGTGGELRRAAAELPGTRVGRERGRGSSAESTNEEGEVGERGAGSKGGEGVRCPENAWTWSRPQWGCGREFRDRGSNWWGPWASERGRARARIKRH
jgi:hypothetical protein